MRRFLASLPERITRSVVALGGGDEPETSQLLLPRLVRASRLYEPSSTVEATPPKELATR